MLLMMQNKFCLVPDTIYKEILGGETHPILIMEIEYIAWSNMTLIKRIEFMDSVEDDTFCIVCGKHRDYVARLPQIYALIQYLDLRNIPIPIQIRLKYGTI